MRIHTLFLLTAALAAGCAGDADECENSLALGIDDDGSEQLIDDGCTSLIVNMPLSDTATWDSPADLDESILRFDYASDGEEFTSYYFTPVGDGEATVNLEQWDLDGEQADSWSAVVSVEGVFE